MSRKKSITTLDYSISVEWMRKFKGLPTKKNISETLGVTEQAITGFQKSGIPLGRLIYFATENKASVDSLLGHLKESSQDAELIRGGIEAKKEGSEDHRIHDILALLKEDPEGTEAVYHFLEAKKNFDRASKSMKQYIGKKLEVWFEFPARGNGEKGDDPGS